MNCYLHYSLFITLYSLPFYTIYITLYSFYFTLSLYMTTEEKISRYEAIRKEYQEKICHRMSKEQYEEYSEILFSTHSCAIEGNSFTVDDTRALKELGLGMVPHGRKLLECMEMADHLRAYEYVMQNLDHPLDEAFLKHINFLLTEHTISYHAPDAVAGEYALRGNRPGGGHHDDRCCDPPLPHQRTTQENEQLKRF